MDVLTIETRMRGDLPRAMKARDPVTVTALRTALAAIANAEAPPVAASTWAEPVVGQRHEAPRLVLTPADIEEIAREQIAERQANAQELAALGRREDAAALRAEAAVLRSYLS